MKREIYERAGLIGLGLTGLGLLIKRDKRNKSITNEETLDVQEIVDLINKDREQLNEERHQLNDKINEFTKTVSAINDEKERFQHCVSKLKQIIKESEEEEIANKNKRNKFESVRDNFEEFLDDNKVKLYDLRCSAIFNDNMFDRNNSINNIVIELVNVYEKMINDVSETNIIKEYLDELRESINDMNDTIKETIENDLKEQEESAELNDLIECVDNILLDILELKGSLAVEKDFVKYNKILKKINSKISYAKKKINESGDLQYKSVVSGMKLKLDEEDEFIKELIMVKKEK